MGAKTMIDDGEDPANEYKGFVISIVLGTVVAVILCGLIIYFGESP